MTRRQPPPPNKTPLIVGLMIAGMILAGCIGWFANSLMNGKTGDAKQELANLKEPPDKRNYENSEASSESPDDLEGIDSTKTPIRLTSERFKTADGTPALEEDKIDRSAAKQKAVKQKAGKPKLSELSSYKDNPKPGKIAVPVSKGRRKVERTDSQTVDTQTVDAQSGNTASSSTEASKKTAAAKTDMQNRYAFPQQSTPIDFYQELVVQRNPQFGIEGVRNIEQKFKYRVISRFSVGPADTNGFRKVTQTVVDSRLLAADALSKKSLEESVKKLVGKEFQFTLDRKQELVDFKGEKDKPKTLDLKDLKSIEGLTGEGFMVSSVMDLDGWREMAQLTFLLPDDRKKKWTGQMEHDWGDLGRWVGETRYEKKSQTGKQLQIDYAHWMRYEMAKEKGGLPFTLGEVSFKSDEAGGRLFFDVEKRRIESLVERFRVEGQISASLLGSSTKLTIKEVQTFEMHLHDQRPQ